VTREWHSIVSDDTERSYHLFANDRLLRWPVTTALIYRSAAKSLDHKSLYAGQVGPLVSATARSNLGQPRHFIFATAAQQFLSPVQSVEARLFEFPGSVSTMADRPQRLSVKQLAKARHRGTLQTAEAGGRPMCVRKLAIRSGFVLNRSVTCCNLVRVKSGGVVSVSRPGAVGLV